jgi:hypothetical protein
MRGKAWNLAILNFVGGVCVLSSYVYGLATVHARNGALWGGVPADWQPAYTVSMFAAAIGYFPFTYFFLRGANLDRARFAGGFAYGAIAACYALILFPSSLWLPLTIRMLESPSAMLWFLIRVDLALVAIGSLGLVAAAATLQPAPSAVQRGAALIGLALFCLQTVVLDAIVWPALFPA